MADSSAATDGAFDPHNVDLDTAELRDIICYVNQGGNDFDGRMPARISAIFVLLVTSTLTTVFPIVAIRIRRLRIPRYVYLFARYFGAGVIIATAFIHLLDPAYEEIGPASCVGLTGGWASYSWPAGIAMTSTMLIFLLDFGAEWYVEQKYGFPHGHTEGAVTGSADANDGASEERPEEPTVDNDNESSARGTQNSAHRHSLSHQFLHSADQGDHPQLRRASAHGCEAGAAAGGPKASSENIESFWGSAAETERAFRQQILGFLILEFGVIFHSIIIGLNLGVVGQEFDTLYPVIVFHQAFEGLGIGARLSMIPFPSRFGWLPWALSLAYGLTTPISVAIGIGLSTRYDPGSYTASVVSGVFDSVSAGILLYTGLVELLARDFLFNKERSRKTGDIAYMLGCLFLGTIIMALLGKWA